MLIQKVVKATEREKMNKKKELYSLLLKFYRELRSECAKKAWETRRKNELQKKQMEKVTTANNKERKD